MSDPDEEVVRELRERGGKFEHEVQDLPGL